MDYSLGKKPNRQQPGEIKPHEVLSNGFLTKNGSLNFIDFIVLQKA
jgi:hypothetical protein